jgi:ABC-2 type transport system permease protein
MTLPSRTRIAELVRKEVRQLFRDPRTRLVMFVAPLVQLVIFGYAVNTDVRNTKTLIVDHDRSAESRALRDAFTASGYFTIVAQSDRSLDVIDALDHGHAVVAIEIPSGFARDLRTGRTTTIQIIVDGTDSNTGTIALGYAQRIARAYALDQVTTGNIIPVDLRIRAWYNPELESRTYNVPAVIGVIILLMCLLLTALAVVRERELGTLDQLMVSPLTPGELMLAKTIPVAGVALVDLILVTSVAIFWFDIPFRGAPHVLLPAALIFILAGLSIGLLISTISKTQQEAFMVMFLFLLPAIILSGFFYPVSSMPVIFQWLTVVNPVRHFLEIVRGVFLKGAGYDALWAQYVALTLIAVGTLQSAIVRFPKTLGR